MTELRTPVQAPPGEQQAGPKPEFPAGQIREFPKTRPSATSPCFIHSSWRTGKTWFSLLFRHFPETVCFYEPFNEVLATLTAAEAVQLGPQSWESGHPSSVSYWREYIPLIRKSGGIRLFRPEMSYDWFIPVGGLRGELREAELKYLALLARYAQRRHQIPVFAFSRSLGRIRPIRERLQGTHIVVIRNLWEQWASYLYQRQMGNPYFVHSILRMIDNPDPFCEYLCDVYFNTKLSENNGKAAGSSDSWERRAEEVLTSLSDGDIFSIFAAIHIYLYLNAGPIADLLIESTRLASDDEYRKLMTTRLREMTGLQLSLADAKESFRFTNADPALVNRNDIERHVRIATNIVTEGDESKELRQLAEQLLDGIYKKGSTDNYLEPARRQLIALRKESERLQAAIGERDAALAAAEARAGLAEASLAEARPELEVQRSQLAELERDRDDRVTAVAQLEVEAADLRARIRERDAALAAAEVRAGAAEASLAGARAELESQRGRAIELQRERDEDAAALGLLEAEAVGLRVRIGERDAELAAAEVRTGAAEASLAVARAELEAQRGRLTELEGERDKTAAAMARLEAEARAELAAQFEQFAELQREWDERSAAMGQLEVEAADLRATISDRDAALATTDTRLIAADANFVETRAELAGQRERISRLERERDDHTVAMTQLEVEAVRAKQEAMERSESLSAIEREAAELRARLGERDAAVTALRAEVALLRKDFWAEVQVARELMTASTADFIEPQKAGRGGGPRSMMLGFGSVMRARALKGGDRARDAKRWQVAVRDYRKALAWDPLHPPTWVQYGHALKETQRLPEAEVAYRESLACDPGVADTHLQLGHVLKLQGRITAAQAAYLRAFALDPAMPFPTQELAGLGWPAAHISRLGALSETLGISELQSLREAGNAARDQRDWPNAARLYEQIVAADPPALDIAIQLGHAYKEMGELERAAHAYYSVLEVIPSDDDLHLQIGHLEKMRGDFSAAAAHYKKAMDINANNADAQCEYDALHGRVPELHHKEGSGAKPEQERIYAGQPDHATSDDVRFLDARAGDIYRQLIAALA